MSDDCGRQVPMLCSTRRLGAILAIVVAPVLVVPTACGGPTVEPEAAEFGKLFQPCFRGDMCDPGLTCLPRAVETDGANLGTDGGQCVCLGSACQSDAGSFDGEAGSQ